MNWKYSQIDRELIFHEPPEIVAKAARAALAESLRGWQFTGTADGFEAKGNAFAHSEIAVLRFLPDEAGTKAQVTLLVQRAGPMGFMLFDIGGAYSNQISKWMEDIQRHLRQGNSSAPQTASASRQMSLAAKFYVGSVGCFGLIILICWLFQTVFAVIALFSGSLYLIFGRESHEITLHGGWARIGAILILLFDALIVFIIFGKKKKTRPDILYPNN